MTEQEIIDLIEELRNTHPLDSGYAENANRAADVIEEFLACRTLAVTSQTRGNET